MLLNIQNMLIDKIRKFLLVTLAYYVNYNEITQEAVRPCPDNFVLLCISLRERFRQNTDVEKDRLRTDFEQLKLTQKKSPREITVKLIHLLRNYMLCLSSM